MDANMQEALRKETWKKQATVMRKIYRKQRQIDAIIHTPIPARPTAVEARAIALKQRRVVELERDIAQLRQHMMNLPQQLAALWLDTIAEENLADADTLLDA